MYRVSRMLPPSKLPLKALFVPPKPPLRISQTRRMRASSAACAHAKERSMGQQHKKLRSQLSSAHPSFLLMTPNHLQRIILISTLCNVSSFYPFNLRVSRREFHFPQSPHQSSFLFRSIEPSVGISCPGASTQCGGQAAKTAG